MTFIAFAPPAYPVACTSRKMDSEFPGFSRLLNAYAVADTGLP